MPMLLVTVAVDLAEVLLVVVDLRAALRTACAGSRSWRLRLAQSCRNSATHCGASERFGIRDFQRKAGLKITRTRPGSQGAPGTALWPARRHTS